MKRLCGILVLSLSMLGLASWATAAEEADAADIYRGILTSTVIVQTSNSYGSGCLIDEEHKLVVTNYHVVYPNKTVEVIFPRFKDGKLLPERSAYKNIKAIKAKVLKSDVKRDLALLQLESLPPGVTAVKLAEKEPTPGTRIHSVGNPASTDAHWLYAWGRVRQVYQRTWESRVGQKTKLKHACRVLETVSAVNPGDSGGPVIDDNGELVGLVHGYSKVGNQIGVMIAAAEVRDFLLAPTPASRPEGNPNAGNPNAGNPNAGNPNAGRPTDRPRRPGSVTMRR
jgi:S1-C subfamily serine protease